MSKQKGGGYGRSETVEKIDGIIMPMQKEKERPKENSRRFIVGRPNIDEISKRNEETAKQERKSAYTIAGIIVFLIIVVMFLVYFFN